MYFAPGAQLTHNKYNLIVTAEQISVVIDAVILAVNFTLYRRREIVTSPLSRGVATGGGYIGIYTPPPKISLPYKFLLAVLFTCGTLTSFDFEIGMTIVKIYTPPPNEISGYAPGQQRWASKQAYF